MHFLEVDFIYHVMSCHRLHGLYIDPARQMQQPDVLNSAIMGSLASPRNAVGGTDSKSTSTVSSPCGFDHSSQRHCCPVQLDKLRPSQSMPLATVSIERDAAVP